MASGVSQAAIQLALVPISLLTLKGNAQSTKKGVGWSGQSASRLIEVIG